MDNLTKAGGIIIGEYLCGPTKEGKWYVRPLSWAGVWDGKTGALISGSTLKEFPLKEQARHFAMGAEQGKLIKYKDCVLVFMEGVLSTSFPELYGTKKENG